MKVFWTLEPFERRNLLILFTSGLVFWTGLASLLPILPLYLKHLGATDWEVGLVMGAFAIGLLLFRPKLGQMADRRGRKIVLLLGTIVAAIAPLGYLFGSSIPLLIAVRAFHGICIAAFTTAYSALVVDLSPLRQRGEIIGYMSLVTPIGVAVGPAIGALIQTGTSYQRSFVFACVLAIISLLGISYIKEIKQPENQQQTESLLVKLTQSSMQPFWQILARPSLLIPSLVLLLFGFAFGALTTFVPLYITEANVNLNPGWFYTAAAFASFSFRMFIGRASDRYGRGIFITASIFFYCLSMLMLSNATSANIFLLAGVLEGGGSGTFFPMMIALISDRSSAQERGRIFAICISGFDLGVAIAAPVFGSLAEYITYRGIFVLSTGMAFLALIIFITLCNKNFSTSLKFALGKEKDLYSLTKGHVAT
ncbi:MAG TPA: MFS transporter [Leptolyngbyaceae cyanobacterium]